MAGRESQGLKLVWSAGRRRNRLVTECARLAASRGKSTIERTTVDSIEELDNSRAQKRVNDALEIGSDSRAGETG